MQTMRITLPYLLTPTIWVLYVLMFATVINFAKMVAQPILGHIVAPTRIRRRRPAIGKERRQRMRVAVVTQHFPRSNERWAGHAAYQTLRLLSESCDVHVFYPVATYPSFITSKASAVDLHWKPSGVKATYIPYPVLPVISRPFNGLAMASELLPHVKDFHPDIILNYTVYPDGCAAVRIAGKLGIPVVVTAIGSDLNRMPDPFCRMMTIAALHGADFVSTVSQDLCNTARRLSVDPSRSSANLNGCDTSTFHPRDRYEARRELGIQTVGDSIVYVGRLDVRKGLIELIEAVSQLRASRPNLLTYIVGDGPDRPLLVEAIERNRAQSFIFLIPSCLTDKVAVWMGSSNLVTLPSYKEGCPNTVIEGLASGRPIVATHVGGIPELMDNTCGRLVAPMDVPALRNALDEVLSEEWNSERISLQHSRSWQDVSDQVYRVLQRALNPA